MNTTLVIMAAGIGSRFGGGIKQLTSFGPNGEIIMDYSIYDAVKAGFNKIVFVIRHDLEDDFKSIIGSRISRHVQVEYAFQELANLPAQFQLPEGRIKPWGTGQAILCCKNIVKEPFAVINADDFYGRDAFEKMHAYLVSGHEAFEDGKMQAAMAGFVLKNTLSENGGVTRGICRLDPQGALAGVDETKNIVPAGENGAAVQNADGTMTPIDPQSLASMNFWGFYPAFIDVLEKGFAQFLHSLKGEDKLKGEYLLPIIVDGMLQDSQMEVSVLPTDGRWFGVTYKEDVPYVISQIGNLIKEGIYPDKLWNE